MQSYRTENYRKTCTWWGGYVAVSLNANQLIERAKQATLNLEHEIAENDKAGLWGFSFDLLVGQRKINLTEEEEDKIIEALELRFDELTSQEYLNPWNAEASAERLAGYFRQKGEDAKVRDLVLDRKSTRLNSSHVR